MESGGRLTVSRTEKTQGASPRPPRRPAWPEFRDANADHLAAVTWQSSTMNADDLDGLVALAENAISA